MIIKEKVSQAKELLKEFNIDCWITFVRESQINGDPILPFLTDADLTWHSAFIFSKDGKTCAIVGRYDEANTKDLGVYDKVIGFVKGAKEEIQNYIKELNPEQIAINYSVGSEICDGLTYGMYLTLYDYLKEIGFENRLISAEKIISALRQRKSQTEINYMQTAINHTLEIFEAVAGYIKPGMKEKEVAAFMKAEVENRKLGFAWEEKVCPAVFSGPDTAAAHYAPSERLIEKGHILNMDFGVKYNGYCSDLQRTFYILKDGEIEAPQDVMIGFNTIVKSVEDAKQAIKPGRFGHEIDKVARDVIVNNGYEEFPHGLGHQVGMYSHDGTALLGPAWEKYAEKPFQPLEEGMVFTIEPRLEVKGKGIATIEEMIVITKEGAEWLSKPQKEIILIRE
ncbi:MAG: Xaa-Pro peptidase family protein [Bacteroidetes bacterium]|nr:Xaa-Pro peptidase family protein [Bacteroidota bacterium]